MEQSQLVHAIAACRKADCQLCIQMHHKKTFMQ